MISLLLGSIALALPTYTSGHGYMYSPRSLNWIAHEDGIEGVQEGVPKREYCHHCLNIKETTELCGRSGARSYDDFLDSAGQPMPWISEETYEEGQIITVKSYMSTHHYGHIEMRICPNGQSSNLACLEENVLEFVEDPLYNAPKDPSNKHHGHLAEADKVDYEMKFRLPEGVYGDEVLLQWKYVTANSCNPPGYLEYSWPNDKWWAGPYLSPCTLPYTEDGSRPANKPEQFWNCARISITASGPTVEPNREPTTGPGNDEPTAMPATPSPTSSDEMCCSWDLKNCGHHSFCNESRQNCMACGGLVYIKKDHCGGYALNKECTLYDDACCPPAKCQGTKWHKQCILTGAIDDTPSPTPSDDDDENTPTANPNESTSAPNSSEDTPAPTTSAPTTSAPTDGLDNDDSSGDGDYCCTWNFVDCSTDPYCNEQSNCLGSCVGFWWDPNKPVTCLLAWEECTNDRDGCCEEFGLVCEGGSSYAQCKPGSNPPPAPTASPTTKPSSQPEEEQPTSSPAPSTITTMTATTTRYWDCSGGSCGCGYGDGSSPVHCETGALFAAPSSNAYGADFYGTAAVSEALGGDYWQGDACGKCFKVDGPNSKTLVLKATNFCPPGNPVCENGNAHFDIAAPGFDYPGASLSNTCTSAYPSDSAMHPPQVCALWSGPGDTCNCDAIEHPTLRQGCKNFLSLGWNNPTVEYEEVDCPSELIEAPPCRTDGTWPEEPPEYCDATENETTLQPSSNPSKSTDIEPTTSPVPSTSSVEKSIIGYYASWQWYDRSLIAKPQNMDFSKVTRVNFAFFQTDTSGKLYGTDSWADPILLFGPLDGSGSTHCSWVGPDSKTCQAHNHEEGLIHLVHAAGAEIYPSIGGWSLSDAFPAMAANPVSRTEFANQCVGLIQEYDFDGIDIDWEYPGYADHSGTPDDRANFNLLMDEVRSKLDALTESTGKTYGLTAALPCGPSHIDNIDVSHISDVLDELNLMSYDLHGAWDPVTGVLAPLHYQGWDSEELSVEACVQNWQEAGASSSKISIGLPFYGRSFLNAQEFNKPHGGNDEVHWDEDDGLPQYFNILSQIPSNMDSFRHEPSKTQYATFKDGSGLVSYDDEQAICDKVQYTIENDLSGFIIWELSGDLLDDLSTPLLDTVNKKLNHPELDCGTEMTSAPTTSPPPTPSAPSCPSNFSGWKAYNSCKQYYYCTSGVVTGPLYACADGTLYNEEIQNCDWEANVTC